MVQLVVNTENAMKNCY